MYTGTIRRRLVSARIRRRSTSIFVICVYVPHKGRTAPAQVELYQQLDQLLDHAPYWDVVLLLGDFNSRLPWIAAEGRHVDRWCMQTRAENGGRKLEESTHRFQLRAVSTYFQSVKKRSSHTDINKQPNLAPSQIDYIILTYLWSSFIRSSKVKWAPSIKRFGREKYDHGFVSVSYLSEMTCSRRASRKYFGALSKDKNKDKDELTWNSDARVLQEL